MSSFDDAWNGLGAAISNTLTERNALDPVSQHDQWHALDDRLGQLEKQRDILAEAAINQVLSTLKEKGALAKLQGITRDLEKAADEIKSAVDKIAAVTQAVKMATALTTFALKLAAVA